MFSSTVLPLGSPVGHLRVTLSHLTVKETIRSLQVTFFLFSSFCVAQGKGRARGGPRKVTQRSFIDGGYPFPDALH